MAPNVKPTAQLELLKRQLILAQFLCTGFGLSGTRLGCRLSVSSRPLRCWRLNSELGWHSGDQVDQDRFEGLLVVDYRLNFGGNVGD